MRTLPSKPRTCGQGRVNASASRAGGFLGVTQREAAARLHISQPRLNDLLKGKIGKFSLDALVNMTSAARLHIHLTVEEEPIATA